MNRILYFTTALFLFTLIGSAQAQQISPEAKALQAASDMQKRLGLKEHQIHYIYSLNLDKIQKTRLVKVERADNHKKLSRDYQDITEAYNLRLRSVLTPEQYQRWEVLREEAKERRRVIQSNLVADNNTLSHETADPEAELDHLVTQ